MIYDAFDMTATIQGDLSMKQVGSPVGISFRNAERMKDNTQYLDEIMSRAEQIIQAINKATEGSV
jgi:hypothetical protein